eukprot:1185647-Prorocentrum_minimum.AAC.3
MLRRACEQQGFRGFSLNPALRVETGCVWLRQAGFSTLLAPHSPFLGPHSPSSAPHSPSPAPHSHLGRATAGQLLHLMSCGTDAAAKHNTVPPAGRHQAGHHANGGGLARPVVPEQRRDLVLVEIE